MPISTLGITYRFVYLILFYIGLFLLNLIYLGSSTANRVLFNNYIYQTPCISKENLYLAEL